MAAGSSAVPLYIVVDDDDLAGEPDPADFLPKSRKVLKQGWRNSVTSECYDPGNDPSDDDDDDIDLRHQKTDEQRQRLVDAVKNILLFRCLDEELMPKVVDAMFERRVNAGELVIEQGQPGDFFYVIDSGTYEFFVRGSADASPPLGQSVLTLSDRGSFGELALMYNQPRAATVLAVTDGQLWAMERRAFRRIVLRSAYRKRQMYEQLLVRVPTLSELNDYERATLSDALRSTSFPDGDCIIREGHSPADGMYFIEDGTVTVTVDDRVVSTLGVGDYFGEAALLEDSPRTASVYAGVGPPSEEGAAAAGGRVKVAFLERDSFERLLGPCIELMKRKSRTYVRSVSLQLPL